jgi:transposase-like protein
MTTKKTRKSYKPEFKAAVVEEYLQGEHLLSEIAAAHGVHPNLILKWKKAAMAALPEALDETSQKSLAALKAQHELEIEQLHAQIGRLTMKLVWLEKKCESMVSRSTRVNESEWTNEELTIKEQSELLRLNRTGLYYKPAPIRERELLLRRRIDEIFTAWPFFGWRFEAYPGGVATRRLANKPKNCPARDG